jgi:hypothetical protein
MHAIHLRSWQLMWILALLCLLLMATLIRGQ